MDLGRIVGIVVGAIMALLGAVIVVGAGAVLLWTGGDNRVGTGTQELSSPTAAIVSGSATIEDERPGDAGPLSAGDLSLQVSASSQEGKPVFLGVGPTAAVDRYLAGVAYDRVSDISFDPFGIEYDRNGPASGSRNPAAPGEQSFWRAKATGGADAAEIDWDLESGSYTLVLMNADGSRDIDADASLELKVPFLTAALVIGLAIGLLLLVGGILLIVFLARSRRPRDATQ